MVDDIVRNWILDGIESGGISAGGKLPGAREIAARCGISAVGVLWGCGSREELSAYSPVLLAQSPGQVADFLLKE